MQTGAWSVPGRHTEQEAFPGGTSPTPDHPNLRNLSSVVGPPSPVELEAFRMPTAGVAAAVGNAADLPGVFLHDVCFQS